MKKLSLLKDWVKVLFILSVTIAVFTPGILILYYVNPEIIPFEVTINEGDEKLNFFNGLATVLNIVGCCFFIYALFLFSKILDLFNRKKIFDNSVIEYLNKIGRLIWYGLLLIIVPFPVYRIFTQNPIKVTFETDEICFVLFIGSLALFFTVLGEVFQMAKNIKEENDLTV